MKLVALHSMLFFLFYLLFVLFDPFIHSTRTISLIEINPWLRQTIDVREGREMYVMLGGVAAYMAFSYLIVRNLRRFSFLRGKFSLLLMIPALAILIRTNSEMVKPPESIAVGLAIVILVPLFLFVNSRLGESGGLGRYYLLGLWVAFGVFVILSLAPPRVHDYSFFIGPALKFLQSERIGTFYTQYNTLGLFLFAAMMKLGMKLHQMEITLAVIFVLWIGLYYLLAKAFIKDRYLLFLFIVALVTLRFFAIMYDPIYIPQVGVIRLDLWVPLLLVLARFGFLSPVTASAFAVGYVLDNFFGLLYLGLYVVSTTMLGYRTPSRLFPLAFVGLGGFVVQFLLTGSLLSSAGGLHQQYALGFIPISAHSLFWIVAFAMPLCLYLFMKEKSRVLYFLLGILLIQLTYFYGRSHEHNLLNISGSIVLVLFIGLNQLAKADAVWYLAKKTIYIVAALLITISALAFGDVVSGKFGRVWDRIQRGVTYDVASIDQDIDKAPDFFAAYPDKDRIVLFHSVDSYLNYRYDLPQVGYYSPFYAHVEREETVEFLTELLAKGYHVVFWEQEMLDLVPYYNESRYLAKRGVQFVLIQRGHLLELGLSK